MPRPKGMKPANYKGGRAKVGSGYIGIYAPLHPRAKPTGYVFEHILVAERVLGKALSRSAVVHHVNGDRADNRPQNLVVCENAAYHVLIHRRKRALESCGHTDWRPCKYCKKYDSPENMSVFGKDGSALHAECGVEYNRRWREKNREYYNQWAAKRRERNREIIRLRDIEYRKRKRERKEACSNQ